MIYIYGKEIDRLTSISPRFMEFEHIENFYSACFGECEIIYVGY